MKILLAIASLFTIAQVGPFARVAPSGITSESSIVPAPGTHLVVSSYGTLLQEKDLPVTWFNAEQDRKEAEYEKANPGTNNPQNLLVTTFPRFGHLQVNMGNKSYELGLRSDGVVVAREMK